jgi:methionine-rich copper-binding protein CopC
MLARTFYAAQAVVVLSFFAITSSASAQSYHRPLRHIKMENNADSAETPARLQVSIQQDKESLKFRLSVLNPQGRSMSVNILKNDDVLFSENVTGDQYFNLFNFTQLEDGDYKVIVFNGKERIIKSIRLQTATTVDRQVSIN